MTHNSLLRSETFSYLLSTDNPLILPATRAWYQLLLWSEDILSQSSSTTCTQGNSTQKSRLHIQKVGLHQESMKSPLRPRARCHTQRCPHQAQKGAAFTLSPHPDWTSSSPQQKPSLVIVFQVPGGTRLVGLTQEVLFSTCLLHKAYMLAGTRPAPQTLDWHNTELTLLAGTCEMMLPTAASSEYKQCWEVTEGKAQKADFCEQF